MYILLSSINRWSFLRQGNYAVKTEDSCTRSSIGRVESGKMRYIDFGGSFMSNFFTITFHDLYVLANNSKSFEGLLEQSGVPLKAILT